MPVLEHGWSALAASLMTPPDVSGGCALAADSAGTGTSFGVDKAPDGVADSEHDGVGTSLAGRVAP
jgi:hypothetical protein